MNSIKDLLLQVNLKEVESKKKIDEIFYNLRKFKETRDFAYLENENQRQVGIKGNLEKNVDFSTKKSRQKEPTPITDITENVIQMENIRVKKENISNAASSDTPVSNSSVSSTIVEMEPEDMPAPKKLPSRKKGKTDVLEIPKRSTRTRTKPRKYGEIESESVEGKSPDVVIQNTTITTIDITDTSDTDVSVSHVNEQETLRSTRSKISLVQKQAPSEETSVSAESEATKIRSSHTNTFDKNQRIRPTSSDQKESKEKERKKSKSNSSSEIEINKTFQTEYEDAVSTLEIYEQGIQNPNATYVASVDSPHSMNETIVLKSHKTFEKHDKRKLIDGEEAALEKKLRTPPKLKSKKTKREIFSSIEKTPLEKVEASQKLQSDFSSIPTKNKLKTPEDENNDNRIAGKSKCFTPFSKIFVPKICSTSKINKMNPGKLDILRNDNDSSLSEKSLSALKASQAEFREREKRRQEKEGEAIKKREALLLAQSEEKKRKREEKQRKAQLQRGIMEKEKHKLLEERIRKEEKYKHTLAEKETKLQKQKEEAEKKRLLAKKKAEILKQQEEVYQRNEKEMTRKLQKQKMQKEQLSSLPIYMTTKPPLLPTYDCHDSDNSNCQSTNERIPDWLKGRTLERTLKTMQVVGDKMKNTLFSLQTHTPDLQEIFVSIDPRKLKRTSSAIWRKPPRYTIFTAASNIHFSEDSEEETHL